MNTIAPAIGTRVNISEKAAPVVGATSATVASAPRGRNADVWVELTLDSGETVGCALVHLSVA